MVENKQYQEVILDNNGYGGPGFRYTNPLTKVFQYEYALVSEISNLFKEVKTNSMCVERLKLYFRELPVEKNGEHQDEDEKIEGVDDKKRKTDKEVLEEIRNMVNRDLIGKVRFPKMQECMAELLTISKEDGKHIFVFTDGVYTFSAELIIKKKNKPCAIKIREIDAEEEWNGLEMSNSLPYRRNAVYFWRQVA